jgi:hypothetical protein
MKIVNGYRRPTDTNAMVYIQLDLENFLNTIVAKLFNPK